jgi:hypothetical protein
MKRRQFNLSVAAASAMSLMPFSLLRTTRAVAIGGGATQVFSFANFLGSPSSISFLGFGAFNGSNIELLTGTSHHGGGAFYATQQPPNSFTTQFTFNFQGLSTSSIAQAGFVFLIQNCQPPIAFSGDANMCGYGGAINQFPPVDAIAIKFDAGDQSVGQNYPAGGLPSSTGLYFNQGPNVYPGGSLGLCPSNDLNPYGINFYTNHTYQVTIVYDGNLLTMVLLDTVNNAQARFVWPLNLANTTNGNGNYVGFSSGSSANGVYASILSWSYWSGYNSRLTAPTFSPSPGNYVGTQTITISYPAGSTCYYTTNGILPTSSSTPYTGAINVSANQVLQAVAIQPGYTDSLVTSGNYVIGTSSNTINFPSGFSTGNLIAAGSAYLSGSSYRVSDTNTNAAGAVWFPIPVTVSAFSTRYQINWGSGGQGMCFVIQNNTQPYTGLTGVQITGTSGQISFNATTLSVGQYVTIAGTFGGTGSISGYRNATTYFVGATNGTTTATLQTTAAYSPSQSGVTFTTLPQSLTAGTAVTMTGPPGGFVGSVSYYVLPTGLTSTTCQLATTPGGNAISVTSSSPTYFVNVVGQGSSGLLVTTPGTPSGLTFSVNASSYSAGPTVVGASGNALGYGGMNALNGTPGRSFGILNSVAIAFNQYGIGSDPMNGVGLYTNGANPYGAQIATGFSLVGSFNVTISYDGTTLTLSMQSTNGGPIFTHSWTINIPSIVGANTGFVGFTGGTGGAASVQAIQSWTYTASSAQLPPTPSAAVPAAPTNLQVK